MDQSQVPNETPQTGGCGCGGNANATTVFANATTPTEQQLKLAEILQRVNQRRNSIYKTKTRLFL